MSYQTLEVELENGQVRTQSPEGLPAKARGLLTILEAQGTTTPALLKGNETGLRHFLAQPDFQLTPEQFQSSMATDFWEQ